jgi:hypothetical protein
LTTILVAKINPKSLYSPSKTNLRWLSLMIVSQAGNKQILKNGQPCLIIWAKTSDTIKIAGQINIEYFFVIEFVFVSNRVFYTLHTF